MLPPGFTSSPPPCELVECVCMSDYFPDNIIFILIHHHTSCIRAISDLTFLTELSFIQSDCTDIGFSALANLVHLRDLTLSYSMGLTDVTLSSFHSLVNLESLNLHCTEIRGTGFHDLSTLTALHTLDISSCENLTDNGVRECAHAFKSLRYLIIGDECNPTEVVMRDTQLTSAAWRHLDNWASPTLTSLDVSGFTLTAGDISVLSRFKLKHVME